jgi:hypothetical protein
VKVQHAGLIINETTPFHYEKERRENASAAMQVAACAKQVGIGY